MTTEKRLLTENEVVDEAIDALLDLGIENPTEAEIKLMVRATRETERWLLPLCVGTGRLN